MQTKYDADAETIKFLITTYKQCIYIKKKKKKTYVC